MAWMHAGGSRQTSLLGGRGAETHHRHSQGRAETGILDAVRARRFLRARKVREPSRRGRPIRWPGHRPIGREREAEHRPIRDMASHRPPGARAAKHPDQPDEDQSRCTDASSQTWPTHREKLSWRLRSRCAGPVRGSSIIDAPAGRLSICAARTLTTLQGYATDVSDPTSGESRGPVVRMSAC